MPRILVPLALAIVGVTVIVGLTQLAPRTAQPPDGAQVATRMGFGRIPAFTGGEPSGDAVSTLALGSRAAESAAPTVGVPAPAPTAPPTDAMMVGEPTIGGGAPGSAGIAVATPDTVAPDAGLIRPVPPEEYLPPRVVSTWEGATLPEIPGELPVFRAARRSFGDAARAIAGGLGLRLPGDLTLMNVAVRGGGDGKSVFSFDGTGGVFSWYTERAWTDQPTDEAPAEIDDAGGIRIANAYLRELGIDLSRYGTPSVLRYDDPCGRGMPCILEGRDAGGTASSAPAPAMDAPVSSVGTPAADVAPAIWPGPGYWPSVTVRYPVLLDGRPTLEWDGTDGGAVTVQVSARDRRAESGSVLLVDDLERSLYPTQSADAIRDGALRGGINPWGWDGGIFTPEEEAKRPVVRIRLTEARLGYLQKYADIDGTPASYFIPVVSFRGTVTDQSGNSYPHAVIVPALDPEAFAVEEPQPIPLGKPVPDILLPSATEAAPAPAR